MRIAIVGMVCLALAGCVNGSDAAVTKAVSLPVMRWDQRPEAASWTTNTLVEVAARDTTLAGAVPSDIAHWCPAYPKADMDERRAFWVAVLSAVAKHESTWNPKASGGGGRWIGLTQISPATARQYGCEATTVAELKDGAANLACAVRIAAVQVGRDGQVAGNGTRGLGRDWAPFRASAKRADMAQWTSQQSYCQ